MEIAPAGYLPPSSPLGSYHGKGEGLASAIQGQNHHESGASIQTLEWRRRELPLRDVAHEKSTLRWPLMEATERCSAQGEGTPYDDKDVWRNR